MIAILAVATITFVFFLESKTANSPGPQNGISESNQDEKDAPVETPLPIEDVIDEPIELVSSIYDFDVDYRLKAIEAAEGAVQYTDRDSYSRYNAISIDPKLILLGNYMEHGAMPLSISLTPFQDISIVADQTDYRIIEESQGAIWIGSIRGTEVGQVELTIVGGIDNPAFGIRILNFPNVISMYQTEVSDVYIAIEANPYKKYPPEY